MADEFEEIDPALLDELVAVYPELQRDRTDANDPTQVGAIIERLSNEVAAARAYGAAGVAAAIGLVIAVGNYEFVKCRNPDILGAANDHLDALGFPDEASSRWG